MMLKNIILALMDQGPPKRFFKNFFITRNAWGLFYQSSHIVRSTGKPKIIYNKRPTAVRAAESMMKKYIGTRFGVYKCMRCDGYHIGKSK